MKVSRKITNHVDKNSELWILAIDTSIYRIEGNFGGGKHWRIWRMTINSPKFNPPIFIQSGLKSHARRHV